MGVFRGRVPWACSVGVFRGRGAENGREMARKEQFYVLLAAVFLSGLGVPYAFLSMRRTYTHLTRPDCDAKLWGIIIDAGSSGSRVHVFSWERGRTLETVREVSRLKRTPGLSSYHDPTHAAESLHKLLLHAHSIVPRLCEAQTPVYLFATAGLRLTAPNRRQAILKSVRELLQSTPYAFSDKNARMLDGGEEAEYDWLSVNVALKSLTGDTEILTEGYSNRGSDTSQDLPTVGVIDLGGASSQIAFEMGAAFESESGVRSVVLKDALYSTPLLTSTSESGSAETDKIIGNRGVRHIYAVSRLNFGMHEAYRLTQKIARSSKVRKNGVEKWFACEIAKDVRDDIGDFFQCEYLVAQFVAEHESKRFTVAAGSEGRSERPTLRKPGVFYGIDNFAKLGSLAYAVTEWLQEDIVTPQSHDILVVDNDLAMFERVGMHICSSTFPTLRKMIPKAVAKDRLLRHSCFGMAYMRALLRKVYGLRSTRSSSLDISQSMEEEDENAWPRLIFAHKVKGVDGSWAMGAMVSNAFQDAGKFWKFDRAV